MNYMITQRRDVLNEVGPTSAALAYVSIVLALCIGRNRRYFKIEVSFSNFFPSWLRPQLERPFQKVDNLLPISVAKTESARSVGIQTLQKRRSSFIITHWSSSQPSTLCEMFQRRIFQFYRLRTQSRAPTIATQTSFRSQP